MIRRGVFLLAAVCLLAPHAARAADFHVATNGNDSHPGTREQPLATLEAARDAARRAGAGPHRIVILPGEYFLARTLDLDARDSGLTIEAAEAGKVTLYGGRPVTGWRRDGDRFWSADLPGVKEGTWDFRALVVNGRMPERARMPETGWFVHQSKFDVPWMSSVGGGWARKPTPRELTTMQYDAKDIPATMEIRNAEVRVYHMWDESLVGVTANDTGTRTLTFSTHAIAPPGAFKVNKYVVFNTREGMTRPGQWYLDRAAGRLVYWPLAGEDMGAAKVIAPVLERIIGIVGTRQAPVKGVILRGLALEAATTPLKPAGFGAGNYDGALRIEWAERCVIENLAIRNVGGQGVQARDVLECRIGGSQVHHTGACGIRISGTASQVARNHIHHVGVYHPSAVALWASHDLRTGGERGFHLYRNEIHDAPYSGIIGSGGGHLIEENLIYRVMRELQDGGAIYGGMRKSILRGNMVRDVVKMGEGYGVSSYYLDEGAQDCIVERNVSVGVERPTHNHIARHLTIRDNVFIAEGDMTLSFQRSGDCTFTGNTLYVPGKINITQPGAITKWANNVIFRDGTGKGAVRPFTIDDAMPPVTPPARRKSPFFAERLTQAPNLDGEIGWDEWPRTTLNLDRQASRWGAIGAPVFARVGYDGRYLYVAVNVAMFDVAKLRKGSEWGKDDGVEIAIAGKGGTFVLRGFAGGTVRSVADAGVPAEAAARLGGAVRFAAKPFGTRTGGWRGEWAIPLEALGIQPAAGLKVAFNLSAYRAEDEVWRFLEGTLGESWRLEEAATLQFK